MSSPIFIVGQGNSGTTLLNEILGKHSQLFTTKETWFFVNFKSYTKIFGNISQEENLNKFICFWAQVFSNKKGNWKTDLKYVKKSNYSICKKYEDCLIWTKKQILNKKNLSYLDIYSVVFEYFTKKNEKKRWVETTPAHLFYCDQILKNFPDAKIVHIIRNPLSVVASGKERWQKRPDRERWLFEPIVRSFAWRTSTLKAKEFETKYKKSFYTIRYEDLIISGEREIKKLCNFLGINFEPQMLEVNVVNPADPRFFDKKGFLMYNLDKWKTILTPEEKKIVVLITDKIANYFGYQNYVEDKTKFINFLKMFLIFLFRTPQFMYYKISVGNVSAYKDLFAFILKRIK